MLEAERRHTKECTRNRADHKRKNGTPEPLPPLSPKELKKCDCPLRVVGVDIRGKWHREALDTKDLFVAAERIRKLELGEPLVAPLYRVFFKAFHFLPTDCLKPLNYSGAVRLSP
jgi:hypothetical protein